MAGFLARRIVSVIFVLWAMTVVVFAIVHVLPGSVAHMILGEYATNEAIAALEERLGLNDPLYLQYWHWFYSLIIKFISCTFCTDVSCDGNRVVLIVVYNNIFRGILVS